MKINTKEVLVWKNSNVENNVFNEATQTFKTISDFDPNLANVNLLTKNSFVYSDPTGIEWIVSVVPFFETTAYTSKNPSPPLSKTLAILVFADKAAAQSVLNDFNSNINTTTSKIFTATIIIIACTAGIVILLMIALIFFITAPLETMRKLSHEIMEISAEDEDKKDYGEILQKSFTNLNRTDEVGILAADYYHIVCILHNRNLEKRETPKYPPNPFFIDQYNMKDFNLLNWSEYLKILQPMILSQKVNSISSESSHKSTNNADHDNMGNLDVLGSMMSQRKVDSGIEMIPVSTRDDLEAQDDSLRYPEKSIKTSQNSKGRDKYYAVDFKVKKVGYLTSLKSQLYSLSGILLSGCVITMIITIVSLSEQGVNWMSKSSNQISDSQVENMISITNTKAVYVKVINKFYYCIIMISSQSYCEQITSDLLVASTYLTNLLDGNLTERNFITEKRYLAPSYSIDVQNNPYNYPLETTKFSGYFVSSDAFCPGSNSPGSPCYLTQVSNQTRLTGLTDIKFRSFFHAYNSISFIQYGIESNGYTRYLPLTPSTSSSSPSSPTSCAVLSTYSALCSNLYYTSKCADASPVYPPYDARCRTWYASGSSLPADHVYFQVPRKSSSGKVIIYF